MVPSPGHLRPAAAMQMAKPAAPSTAMPTVMEVAMKLLTFMAVAALLAGGFYYRADVSNYFANLSARSSDQDKAPTLIGSMEQMGNAGNDLLMGADRALHQ